MCESRLSEAERAAFKEQKLKELDSWHQNNAWEPFTGAVPEGIVPIQARWVLTYKRQHDGTTRPKARLVLKGFQDPSSDDQEVSAPTMGRASRNIILCMVSMRRCELFRADATAACLQSVETNRMVLAEALPDIAHFYNITPGSLMLLRKETYGLTTAPRAWLET